MCQKTRDRRKFEKIAGGDSSRGQSGSCKWVLGEYALRQRRLK